MSDSFQARKNSLKTNKKFLKILKACLHSTTYLLWPIAIQSEEENRPLFWVDLYYTLWHDF